MELEPYGRLLKVVMLIRRFMPLNNYVTWDFLHVQPVHHPYDPGSSKDSKTLSLVCMKKQKKPFLVLKSPTFPMCVNRENLLKTYFRLRVSIPLPIRSTVIHSNHSVLQLETGYHKTNNKHASLWVQYYENTDRVQTTAVQQAPRDNCSGWWHGHLFILVVSGSTIRRFTSALDTEYVRDFCVVSFLFDSRFS